MIVELGHWSLWLAALTALFGPTHTHKERQHTTIKCLALIALATGTLVHALMSLDWSVLYVAQHTHNTLPMVYRFAALWSAHEGSMLLWVLITAFWCWALVAHHNTQLPNALLHQATRLTLWLLGALLLFVLLTSNPFERILPIAPQEGMDLNPLLQDAALVIHPPLLYLGYLGFMLPCALAGAALLEPQHLKKALEAIQPWVWVSWAFLTLGIALGSFWAYYELGWGGWWFWDPVENASLMPWLCGLILMHSNKHAQNNPAWVLFLALLAFSFSLLGTFLVRSGVISSVHSFASDSTRGLWLLMLWGTVVLSSLLGWCLRLQQGRLNPKHRITSTQLQTWVAFEALLFLMLLIIAAGTLYPLLHTALYQEELSVGAPYFNETLRPFAMLTLVGMGLVPFWSQATKNLKSLLMPALALYLIGLIQGWSTQALLHGALWALLAWTATLHLFALKDTQRPWMLLGHLGLFVSLAGMTADAFHSTQKVAHLNIGQAIEVAGEQVLLESVTKTPGPAYDTEQAHVRVGEQLMTPERRMHHARNMITSEVALKAHLTHDWYVALGGEANHDQWIVRIQKHPGVRLIWLGAVLMACAGFGAWWGARRRRKA